MLPEGFAARMRALLGSEYGDFLASFDRPLCTGLRKNPLKAGFTGDLSRFSLAPVPWCPTGFYYDAASRPGLSPYHAAGLYYLQEPSAMAPAELLDPQPGERVLETVVLLSKLKVDHHIEIELKMDELDLTAAESKATYDEIKAYVLNKYGLKVSQLYIAQIKRKCGIIERKNYNVSKKEDAKVPQCPPEKEAAIMDALKHFQMI